MEAIRKERKKKREKQAARHIHRSKDERQRKRQMNWRSVQDYLTNKEV